MNLQENPMKFLIKTPTQACNQHQNDKKIQYLTFNFKDSLVDNAKMLIAFYPRSPYLESI